MRKRLLSVLLALCMVLTLMPISAFAEESDFVIENGVLSKYNGPGGAVTIPDNVTTIGAGVFNGCAALTSVTIPGNVTSIGNNAFCNCSNLVTATIPDSVNSIGVGAFQNCTSLTSIIIPDGVKQVANWTFENCKNMTSIVIPASVLSLGHNSFCLSGLTNIDYTGTKEQWNNLMFASPNAKISDNVTIRCADDGTAGAYWAYNEATKALRIWGTGAMVNYTSLSQPWRAYKSDITTVTIDNGVTSIGSYAFYDCSNLTSVDIPNSVTSIKRYAFTSCSSLAKVTIPDTVTAIGAYAFNACTALTNVTIPGNVTSIENNAFCNCSNLITATIPDSVNSIGVGAFQNCTSLTSIVIPDGVTQIANWTFENCKNMTSIVIPASVLSLGHNSFCLSGLTNVDYTGTKEQWDNLMIASPNAKIPGNATIHCSSTGPDVSGGESPIVERVKSYTSDKIFSQYKAIMESNDSDETKMQRITELFLYYGFLDPQEGVSYLSDTTGDRYSYLMLTTDEIYTAYQYYNWLNHTSGGLAARGLLWVDGLVFNSEVSTWVNPFTYFDDPAYVELPAVSKYKDMLYDFLNSKSEGIEIVDTISVITDLSKNVTANGKIYADDLINRLNKCKSISDRNRIMQSASAQNLFLEISNHASKNKKYSLDEKSGFGQFSKEVGISTGIISLAVDTTKTIQDITELSGKLAVYNQYQKFLNEVATSSDLPWELSRAAAIILREIEMGYFVECRDFAYKLLQKVKINDNTLSDGILKSALGEVGAETLGGFLNAVEVEAWFINQIVDIGEIVKGIAYIEGYVHLGLHFSKKLEESKAAFVANPTEENAWVFYENYNLLHQLRYKGEEAVLQMNKIKGIASYFTDFGFAEKKVLVDRTLEQLELCRFALDESIEIPPSIKYASKAVINCPVNVEVYAPNGEYITTLTNGAESDITNSYGRFAVVRRVYSGDYAKVICLKQDGDYKFKIIGQDDGLVNFEFARNADTEIYTFKNVKIAADTAIQTSVDQVVKNQTYDIDVGNDGTLDQIGTIQTVAEGNYIAVSTISLDRAYITLTEGESDILTVSLAPANASRQNVSWVSSDSSIVSISAGKITANAIGTAKIYCVSQDNPDVQAVCTITVKSASGRPHDYTVTFNANGGTVALATMTTGTDGKLASLPIPTLIGYTFDGWYTSAIGGERVDENHVYTADATLYAHWTQTKPDDGKLHGRVTISATFAENDSSGTAYTIGGETVTLRAYPDAGYRLSSIQVIGPDGEQVPLTQNGDTFTFAMPTFDVTVCPEFTKI